MYNIKDIIPLNDRDHREGFSNECAVDKLDERDRHQLENELIYMLIDNHNRGVDTLITKTLAYLKSEKAISTMLEAINWCYHEMDKLSIYASIFEINGDINIIPLALTSFRKLEIEKDRYQQFTLISCFHFLAKFHRPETDDIIKAYVNHKEYLVAYNAKRSLGLPAK